MPGQLEGECLFTFDAYFSVEWIDANREQPFPTCSRRSPTCAAEFATECSVEPLPLVLSSSKARSQQVMVTRSHELLPRTLSVRPRSRWISARGRRTH
jgi:hypothetical protein